MHAAIRSPSGACIYSQVDTPDGQPWFAKSPGTSAPCDADHAPGTGVWTHQLPR
jgi:hypothetical protein